MAKRERSDAGLNVYEPPKREKVETFPIRVTGAKTISRSWLESTFKHYGKIHSIELSTGETSMVACLHLPTYEAAKTAAKEMNGELVNGRTLHVELIQSQERPQPTEVVAQHPACSSQSVPTSATTTISTTQPELESLKLTNIPLTTSEATLQEKCGALEGFSSLKLVKVGNSTTNYAWVNYSTPHAMSAQKALDGMIVDGNKIKASQPRPYKIPLTSFTLSEAAQVAIPVPSAEFSFKLPDTATPPSASVPHVPVGPSTSPPHRPESGSSRSPSPGPVRSLFNPVPCGLSLPSAHNMTQQHSPPPSCAQEVPPEPLQAQSSVSSSTGLASPPKLGKEKPAAMAEVHVHVVPQAHKQKTKSHRSSDHPLKLMSKGQNDKPTTVAEVVPQEHKQKKIKSLESSSESHKPLLFELSSGSSEPVSKVPVLKHSQTQPVALEGLTACKAQTGPLKDTDVKHLESGKQNPFKQALAKHSSLCLPMKSVSTEHIQKPAPEVKENVSFSEALIKRIVTSECGSELKHICDTFQVDVRGQEVDGMTLTLSCKNQSSLRKARDKVMALGQQAKAKISDRTFTIHCCFLPCLADSDTIALLQAIEKESATEFIIVTTSRWFKLSECKQHLHSILSEAETPLKLSSVAQFAENRVGYCWKVVHPHTQKETSFDTDVNESINTSYINGEATCSFEYKGHSYTVDFTQMTLIDKTLKKQHKMVKEPLWRYLKDEDFGYQPLSDATSKQIEEVFHHGAPGFVELEGEECVFNFHSKPMYVQSVKRREHVFIQRDPPASSKDHVVTVKARGILNKLSCVEEKFHHTLRERITSEIIEIPLKINTEVFQHLLLSMMHQYCVECTLNQSEVLISVKGTKENATGVKTCLQQEFIKILSQHTASSHHFPLEWDPQTENIALCTVAEGSSEWRHIVALMKESMPAVKVKRIERIQNKSLWQKYEFFKTRMEEATHGNGVNEKELFHGTRKTHPSQIYESDKGFDFRFGRESSLWGQGTYFAVKASYSDRNYAYNASDGCKQLLLAKVVTGDSKYLSTAENLKLPPLKPGKMIERYDTVRATTGGSDVYIVYDHEKAYPAYIISYNN